jgi:hypothetical protein
VWASELEVRIPHWHWQSRARATIRISIVGLEHDDARTIVPSRELTGNAPPLAWRANRRRESRANPPPRDDGLLGRRGLQPWRRFLAESAQRDGRVENLLGLLSAPKDSAVLSAAWRAFISSQCPRRGVEKLPWTPESGHRGWSRVSRNARSAATIATTAGRLPSRSSWCKRLLALLRRR